MQIFQDATPSVVYINTFIEQRNAFSMNVMEVSYYGNASTACRIVSSPAQPAAWWWWWQVPAGTGSGFVWDDNGYIVTNYHVIRSAESAQVHHHARTAC